jgi:hypothetical protein
MGRYVGVLALALGLIAGCRPAVGREPPVALYLAGPAFTDGAAALTPLDPAALADRADAPPVGMGVPGGLPIWALSGDGSTLVALDHRFQLDPARVTAVVREVPGGAERARFTLDQPVGPAHLSRDGRRLVVTETVQRGPGRVSPRSTWRVIDTGDGRVLARVEIEGDGLPSWIDAEARRLYAVVQSRDDDGPRPLVLTAADLTTGATIGRLELPDVANGTWTIRRPRPSQPGDPYLIGQAIPGIDLAPDGRHLAVVPTDADVVILIDAERMAVERRVPFARPEGLWRWLPFWPRPAAAKGVAGVVRQAAFAPDGRQLYLRDAEYHLDAAGGTQSLDLRLLRVDLDRGAIAAAWRPSEPIYDLQVDLDGRSLYLVQPAPNPDRYSGCSSPACPYVVRRLDATSLAVVAERPIVGHRQPAVRPRR